MITGSKGNACRINKQAISRIRVRHTVEKIQSYQSIVFTY